jgi:hypothetical protein
MVIAPPSRTMMPSFGNAFVASTTKRAGWTGVLPLGADTASSATRAASSFTQTSSCGDAERGESSSAATSWGTMSRRSPTSGTSIGRFTPMANGSSST